MAENYNKLLYKIFLIFIKYIPFIIAVVYFICGIIECIGFEPIILSNISFLSPISALFILCASFLFKFCIWHRLPIYYSIVLQIISFIDYYSTIMLSNNVVLFIYLIITIFTILIGMYLKNKKNG